jgi:dUTP pyrophosphatase
MSMRKEHASRRERELLDLPGAVLSKSQIRALLRNKPPLIEKLIDLTTQLQPNGVDLTVMQIEKITSAGCVDFNNKDRKLSETEKLDFDGDQVFLPPGPYKVLFNEIIHLPKDIMAIGAPRTSLIRCGVTVKTGFWDAGYEGRSESLLVVVNEKGFYLKKNARILQLAFIKLSKVASSGYEGIYQSENIGQSQKTLEV